MYAIIHSLVIFKYKVNIGISYMSQLSILNQFFENIYFVQTKATPLNTENLEMKNSTFISQILVNDGIMSQFIKIILTQFKLN